MIPQVRLKKEISNSHTKQNVTVRNLHCVLPNCSAIIDRGSSFSGRRGAWEREKEGGPCRPTHDSPHPTMAANNEGFRQTEIHFLQEQNSQVINALEKVSALLRASGF